MTKKRKRPKYETGPIKDSWDVQPESYAGPHLVCEGHVVITRLASDGSERTWRYIWQIPGEMG